MRDDLKARFIAYAAREKDRRLDEDVPEEMDDLAFRYVNRRLGIGYPEDQQVTPEEIAAIEAAVAEDAASAEVVRVQLEGASVINQIILPGMLAQWAEGTLDTGFTLPEDKRPSRPMSAMHQALQHLVLEARGEALTPEQQGGLEDFLRRYAGVGEPLVEPLKRAAMVIAEGEPAIAARLAEALSRERTR